MALVDGVQEVQHVEALDDLGLLVAVVVEVQHVLQHGDVVLWDRQRAQRAEESDDVVDVAQVQIVAVDGPLEVVPQRSRQLAKLHAVRYVGPQVAGDAQRLRPVGHRRPFQVQLVDPLVHSGWC